MHKWLREGTLTYGEEIARCLRVLSKGWEGDMMCHKDGEERINKQNSKGNNFELHSKKNKGLIDAATFSCFFFKALAFRIRK